jgi:hypothetical protein
VNQVSILTSSHMNLYILLFATLSLGDLSVKKVLWNIQRIICDLIP